MALFPCTDKISPLSHTHPVYRSNLCPSFISINQKTKETYNNNNNEYKIVRKRKKEKKPVGKENTAAEKDVRRAASESLDSVYQRLVESLASKFVDEFVVIYFS